MILESFERNLDCTTGTHSGQVDLNLDSGRQRTVAAPFVQQAFSQLLYEGSQLSHRGSTAGSAVDKKAAHHQRKMSQPNPPSSQIAIQVKKSPSKGSAEPKIFIGGASMLEPSS